MEPNLGQLRCIADDLPSGRHDDFAARFAVEGLAQIDLYLAGWAALRDLADDDADEGGTAPH